MSDLGWLEAIAAPTLLWGGEGDWQANTAARGLLGLLAGERSTRPLTDWVRPDQRHLVQPVLAAALNGRDDAPTIELTLLPASAPSRALELSARPWSDGVRTWAVVSLRDLSDIHSGQESLLELSQLLHQIMENDPVPAFLLDEAGRVGYWNAACERLTGVRSLDILGQTQAWHAFYPEPRPLLAELVLRGQVSELGPSLYGATLRSVPSAPRAWQFEAYYPRLGGQGRWLSVTAAPLLDVSGHVVGALETLQDVTDRHEAETELQRHRAELETMVAARTAELLISNHELDAFMANAPVGVLATQGTRLVRSNRTFCRMFGVDESETADLRADALFSSRDEYRGLFRQARKSLAQGDAFTHEAHMRNREGGELWVQLIAYLSDALDGPSRVWWLVQDRTEVMRAQRELVENYRALKTANRQLLEAQNQLIQAEKMASLGQLSAGVAHEINNPLGFVGSNLGSLRRYAESLQALLEAHEAGVDPDALRALRRRFDIDFVLQDLPALLNETEEGLARVKKIVQDLKDFSRVDQSDWQDADLNEGLDSTLNMAMHELKHKARVVKAYGDIPRVHCLAGQLNQVFMNLVVNAAQAIEQDGEIVVRTGVGAHDGVAGVWVEVQDNGIGMTPEVQRRVFEPFFTTKPVGQGTGLGLSLSFSIIKKHEGHIELDSTPGVGTRFRVWVPVAGPQGAGRPPH